MAAGRKRNPRRREAGPAPAPAMTAAVLTLPEPPRSSQLLPMAIAVSVVVHASLLLLHFVAPDGRLLENFAPPLEVVLVNSKSARKPVKADALAQANLDGGGNTEADRRAKSNLPVVSDSTESEQVSVASRHVKQLETEVQRLLTQLSSEQKVATALPAPRPAEIASEGREPLDAAERRQQIARLEAQIAKQWESYQKLPKRKFIGARTEEAAYAQYVDEWRQRIERVGTHNFPEEARRRGLYGTLLITVSIRSDGTVEKVEIDRSSGHPVLDKAARRVVQLAAPFAAFPPNIRKDYDILSITRNWSFTKSDQLVSE
jgi:protein TonB